MPGLEDGETAKHMLSVKWDGSAGIMSFADVQSVADPNNGALTALSGAGIALARPIGPLPALLSVGLS